MLPIIDITTTSRSDRLHAHLHARAVGAFDAYDAVQKVAAEEVGDFRASASLAAATSAAWGAYQRISNAQEALYEAERQYWTEEAERRQAVV